MRPLYLPWDEPLLPAAAAWLRDEHARNGLVDLGRVTCVLPGRRAGRALLGRLIVACEERGFELIPPRTCTPPRLAETALDDTFAGAARLPIATAAEMRWAWDGAIGDADAEVLERLVREPPERDDVLGRHRLGRLLLDAVSALDDALAAPADAARFAESFDLLDEAERWRAIDRLAASAADRLRDAGLLARTEAVGAAIASGLRPQGPVVLIGVTEIVPACRALLDAWSADVTALVHAPRDREEAFDAWGAPDPTAWSRAPGVPDDVITIADDPEGQAQAALDAIDSLGGTFAADQITIGVTDSALAEVFMRAALPAGIGAHVGGGTQLDRTSPARLLAAVADLVDEPRLAHWAALARHPDAGALLDGEKGAKSAGASAPALEAWPAILDRWAMKRLDGHPTGWFGDEPARTYAERVRARLGPFTGPPRTLGAWAERFVDLLRAAYAGTDPDSAVGRACTAFVDLLEMERGVTSTLAPALRAPEAVRLLLAGAESGTIARSIAADEVEVLGWHELAHDSAPVLIVLGMNEGAVPERARAEPFLPNRLRAALDLPDDSSRFARDAHALGAIMHSRPRLHLVVGRRDSLGEPLLPSRLVLGAPSGREEDVLARRLRAFSGNEAERAAASVHLPRGAPAPGATSRFKVPDLPPLDAPDHLRVTSFSAYLRCPYRFALGQLLRLEQARDDVTELDPLAFGSLAHEVLGRFGGDDEAAELRDADEIEQWLCRALAQAAEAAHGPRPRVAVQVQLDRLRQRLAHFAHLEARERASGWRTIAAEVSLGEAALLDVPGELPMRVSGKIDRIDRHDATGAHRILDYKTSETAKGPHETHNGVKPDRLPGDPKLVQWRDLQLPLYAHFAQTVGVSGPVTLGYVTLSREDPAFRPAVWTAEHLESAALCAQSIVRRIRANDFPMNDEAATKYDEFARICQNHALGDSEEDEG